MTDPIENLSTEHRAALEVLDRLEGLLSKEALDAGDTKTIKEINTFFAEELDIHLRKEEEALFPALEPHLGRQGGPIGVMLYEHEDLRRAFEQFRGGVAAVDAGSDPSGSAVRESGDHIVGVLTNHIHKEDEILFRMAQQVLSEETLAEVGNKMKALEAEALARRG